MRVTDPREGAPGSPADDLGKLYRRTGKRQEAHEHLTTATTMYREMEHAVLAGAGGGGDGRPEVSWDVKARGGWA